MFWHPLIFPAVLFFVVLVVILVVSVSLYAISIFVQTEATTKAAILGVISVTAAAILTHLYAQSREINARQFPQKAELCESILLCFFSQIWAVRGDNPKNVADLEEQHFTIANKMLIWGSEELIRAWNEFKHMPLGDDVNPGKVLLCADRVLCAMRKELGHKDKNLEEGDLIKQFIRAEEHSKIDMALLDERNSSDG